VIRDCKTKQRLAEKNSLVVEMENYWAAQKALEWQTHFLSIRVVLDTFCEQLPDLMKTIQSNGEISFVHVLQHLLLYPQDIPKMTKIFFHSRKILLHLASVCQIAHLARA
jgi:hypothetical protein